MCKDAQRQTLWREDLIKKKTESFCRDDMCQYHAAPQRWKTRVLSCRPNSEVPLRPGLLLPSGLIEGLLGLRNDGGYVPPIKRCLGIHVGRIPTPISHILDIALCWSLSDAPFAFLWNLCSVGMLLSISGLSLFVPLFSRNATHGKKRVSQKWIISLQSLQPHATEGYCSAWENIQFLTYFPFTLPSCEKVRERRKPKLSVFVSPFPR